MHFSELLQHDDADRRHAIRPKQNPAPIGPKKNEAPPPPNVTTKAQNWESLAPPVAIFQKHLHIREAVIAALRDEGIRS